MVGRLPGAWMARLNRLIVANDSPACLVLADPSCYANSADDQQTGTLTARSACLQLPYRPTSARGQEKIHGARRKTRCPTWRSRLSACRPRILLTGSVALRRVGRLPRRALL